MFDQQRTGIPGSVRISKGDYEALKERAKKINAYALKKEQQGEVAFSPSLFPTVEELEEHGVKYRIREFLLYLVFYREPEICGLGDDRDYLDTKEYIDQLFANYVVEMEDEDCEGIRSMTAERWKKMSMAERAAVLEPVMAYYGWNEYDNFIKDLGWLPFMQYARCSEARYRKNGMSTRLSNDMETLWDMVQRAGW